jgi:heat shock protein HtpX
MGAVGLKTYIWNNNFKSLLLLAGFPVLLTGMVYAAELMLMAWGLLPSTGRLGGDLAQAFAGLVRDRLCRLPGDHRPLHRRPEGRAR